MGWNQLFTANVEQARANYAALFGWEFAAPIALGEHGTFHPFAWERGGATVGWITDTAGRSGVHAQWLFQLHVDDLDLALATAGAAGATIVGTFTLPDGHRVTVCDDVQGAAFALRERRPSAR